MDKNPAEELPIRSKLEMLEDIVEIISHLHHGERPLAEPLIDDLKSRALFLDEQIQQDVLEFSEQIHFQYDYDPWPKVTPEIQKAADRLIEDLGFPTP
jgi:hypothetical protein